MTVYVALLRGINVGGHNKLAMADLRRIAAGCGFGDVQTYIQSGNAVFSTRLGATKVGSMLHDAILGESGVDSRVVIRTSAELAAVVRGNPFLARGLDPQALHVTFLYPETTPRVDSVDGGDYATDEVVVSGANAFLHTPDGMGKAKVAAEPMIRRLGIQGTTRNWRTVCALDEMSAAVV